MSQSSGQLPGRYTRIHVLPGPVTVRDAASFLASALLVSNAVRRRSVAAVEVGDGLWLYVAGDVVRHLRPDADTAEGWVRAVLRGKKGLGGRIASAPPSLPEGYLTVSVDSGPGGCRIVRSNGYYIVYAPGLGAGPRLGMAGLPPWLAPAVVNVVIDRLEAGLPPAPCCERVNIPAYSNHTP